MALRRQLAVQRPDRRLRLRLIDRSFRVLSQLARASLFLTSSCVTPSHPPIKVARLALSGPPRTTIDVHAVADAMARLRGTTYDTPLPYEILDPPAFVARLHVHESSQHLPGLPKSFWAGFHFASDDRGATEAQLSAVNSAVSGFYDPKADELFIRRGGSSLEVARFTVAHEIAHAVQRRMGAIPWQSATVDEELARRAFASPSTRASSLASKRRASLRSAGSPS